MPDKTSEPLTDPKNVEVVFVNEVAGIGVLNGVVNLTLSTALFTPQGNIVLQDKIIGSRLRFDLFVAQSLHTLLGDILEKNTKGAAQPRPKMDA